MSRRAEGLRPSHRTAFRSWFAHRIVLALACALGLAGAASADTVHRSMGDGLRAAWTDQQRLFLEAPPRDGEGLYAFTRRFTGSTRDAATVASINGRPRRLLAGVRYRIPYELLSDTYKVRVVRALFTDDGPADGGWRHQVPKTTRGATLWRICEWFTGRGETYKAVARHNGLSDYDIFPGQSVVIPTRLLLPAFAQTVSQNPIQIADAAPPALPTQEPPPPPPPAPRTQPESAPPAAKATGTESSDPAADTAADAADPPLSVNDPEPDDIPRIEVGPPVAASSSERPETPSRQASQEFFTGTTADGDLRYVVDPSGERHAVYHLKRGEALYTAVVVRFTGRVTADAVNELASELAKSNGIRDVTDMPVGQRVRIPLDVLLPEYLPPDDSRRQEWEQNRAASAQYSNTVRASRLEDITIILDAGHGGEDPGVDHRGIWESVYVYDVMVRVRRLLEERTSAAVWSTTRDGHSFELHDRDVLPRSQRHAVLTTPEYPIRDHVVGTHLRWYLANSLYEKANGRSQDPGKTIFVSLHADSLHPSLRGAMAYVPSTSLTHGEFGKSGQIYLARREVKERPRVEYSWKERTRSEGLSRELAADILDAFRHNGLRVHPEKPIRDRIIRSRRSRPFVPAVVRYNAVPTKLLLEICNMNNPQDRELLQTRAFRQQVAESIVDGILAYYGQEPLVPSSQVASTR